MCILEDDDVLEDDGDDDENDDLSNIEPLPAGIGAFSRARYLENEEKHRSKKNAPTKKTEAATETKGSVKVK